MLEKLAEKLFTKDPFQIEKTPELEKRFQDMAVNVKPNGRTPEDILSHCKHSVMEDVLARELDISLNDLPFRHTNPETFYYDVIDRENNIKYEVKTFKEKWLSFYDSSFATFIKYHSQIDYLIAAEFNELPDKYEVGFRLVADAKSFFDYRTSSMYNEGFYYNHYSAKANGHAKFNEHQYFRS